MFCPGCGAKSKGLCLRCYLKSNPIFFGDVFLIKCSCGRVKYKNHWFRDLDDILDSVLEDNLVVPEQINTLEFELMDYAADKNTLKVRFNYKGRYLDETFSREIEGSIGFRGGNCPFCGKIAGGYFECTLQLRIADPPHLFKDINPDMVSKMEKVRGGVDVYLISSDYANQLMKQYRGMGFFVKDSYTLMGKKEGKDVYRSTISVKEPAFGVGDFIKHDNKNMQVLELGSTVRLRVLSSGKNISLPLNSIADYKPVAKKNQINKCIVTSVSPGDTQLLFLGDNKTLELGYVVDGLKPGVEVNAIRLDDKVYILK